MEIESGEHDKAGSTNDRGVPLEVPRAASPRD
jgi:hypothetical protein